MTWASRNNENIRMIIRKIEDLDKLFSDQKQKFNIFLSNEGDLKLIDSLLKSSDNHLNELFIYFNKNKKLISLDFSNNYEIFKRCFSKNKLNKAVEGIANEFEYLKSRLVTIERVKLMLVLIFKSFP